MRCDATLNFFNILWANFGTTLNSALLQLIQKPKPYFYPIPLLLLPVDDSTYANSEVDSHFNLLEQTYYRLSLSVQCIIAYIHSRRIPMHLHSRCGYTMQNVGLQKPPEYYLYYKQRIERGFVWKENKMISLHDLMCLEHGEAREHHIVEECKPDEHAKPCIYGWAEIILDLYDSGRERPAKRIVVTHQSKRFELDLMRQTLKDASASLLCIRETGSERFRNDNFKNYFCLLK